ncbi:MAG: sigma-70 family RNA polymerase sigma factor, partial [Nitriliruptor sp.]
MNPVELPTADTSVDELLERSAERGYVLLSELQELYVPELHGTTWMDDAATSAADAGVQVIDDVADDAPEALADPTAALTTDLVRQYLNDAGRHALLTKEDEADLAKRYQAGLAADVMMASKDDPPTRARKARLRTISRDGAKAKERMVQANLRLVVPQARKFSGRDLDFIELIQEGNLGLLRAVEKFDHTKGYKFSTYAVW